MTRRSPSRVCTRFSLIFFLLAWIGSAGLVVTPSLTFAQKTAQETEPPATPETTLPVSEAPPPPAPETLPPAPEPVVPEAVPPVPQIAPLVPRAAPSKPRASGPKKPKGTPIIPQAAPTGPETTTPPSPQSVLKVPSTFNRSDKISLDFKDVDLPMLVKFFSELTHKNFIIDEKVRGKVTIFSPAKLSIDDAYRVFLSVLELKGFAAIPVGRAIQIIPVNEVPPDRIVEVYPLANANAEDLVKVVSAVVARPAQAATARPTTRPPGELEGLVQLLADKPTNSAVITASSRDMEIVKTVIRKLDTARRQVYVEAVIMEVSMTRARSLGGDITALVGKQTSSGNLTVVGGVNTPPPDLSTLLTTGLVLNTAGVSPVNVRAVLTALQTRGDVNILSTPQILTSDNQKAEIIVGENRPFPTGQSQTSGGNTITTIERRDVGITLRLTPQILESDLVKLDVFQEISTVTEDSQTVGSVVLGPTTNKRSATTSVLVKDGQTAVIGGLIRDNVAVTERKVPLLGDIPLVGWLFKFHSKTIDKTNLLIFLTPTIVKFPQDVDELKTKKSVAMTQYLDNLGIKRTEPQRALLDGVNLPRPKQ